VAIPRVLRQRWLPALVLPLIAVAVVAVLRSLANLAETEGGLDRQRVASPRAPADTSLPASSSPGLPRKPAAPAPTSASLAARSQEQKPAPRRGFSPVLDREPLAHGPSGGDVIPNPPDTELPTAREIPITPSTAQGSLE
jgi:hypothetical protein